MITVSGGNYHKTTFGQNVGHSLPFVAGVFLLLGCQADADAIKGFTQTTIQIETRAGRSVELEVFLALSRKQQARGLMFVEELGDRQGMLFVYRESHNISMWMKNTVLPLDMLFIRQDGSIARIEKETEPFSLDSIVAGEPVLAVLELQGGIAEKYGIQPGDRVISKYFAAD